MSEFFVKHEGGEGYWIEDATDIDAAAVEYRSLENLEPDHPVSVYDPVDGQWWEVLN